MLTKKAEVKVKEEMGFVRAFFEALFDLGEFSADFTVFLSRTNAERNMYQSEFLSILEEARELFVLKYLPQYKNQNFFVQGKILTRTSFRYIKNFYFGDTVKVTLKIKETTEEYFIFETRFFEGDQLHSIGQQKIFFTKQKNIPEYFDNTQSGIFPHKLSVTRSLSPQGYLEIAKIAELFGDTREEFGIFFLPNFLEDIKSRHYGLATRNAEYEYFRPVLRGTDVIVRLKVIGMGETERSFFLEAEYTTLVENKKEIINIRAHQEIVYVDINGKSQDMPDLLANLIKFSIEQISTK